VVLARFERFAVFLERLSAAAPADSAEGAYELLSATLNAVEDEFSDVPFDPAKWKTDGRMYPPQPDNRRAVAGYPEVVRYRSLAHHTLIGSNGSIQIITIRGVTELMKPGVDGRHVWQI
jgi:hypothetical protein